MAGRRGKVQTAERPGSAAESGAQNVQGTQAQTQTGGKGFYVSRKVLVALALAGVLVVAAVLFLGGVVTGQNTAAPPPTAAERVAKQQREAAVEAAKGINFSPGTIKEPVDGATDGLEVIGSFFLYAAQGKTEKALQYVVNPNERSVQKTLQRIQAPEAAEARRQLLESGLAIPEHTVEFVLRWIPENPVAGETYRFNQMLVGLMFYAGVETPTTSPVVLLWVIEPELLRTETGWRIAGFDIPF